MRAQEIERFGRRAATGRERRDDGKERLERLRDGARVGDEVGREALNRAHRLAVVAVLGVVVVLEHDGAGVRRPVEQAFVAVEPVPRRRLIAPRYGVDEIQRRFAADEVVHPKAIILYNL